jgi:hypothetical protein
MNNIQFLFILSVGFSSQVLAATTNEPKSTTQQSIVKSCNPDEAVGSSLSPSVLEKNVEEALKAIKAKSPQVHEDSLRVFKNFKSHSKPVHWTYRSWGRSLILWLRDEKDMAFNTREKVGKVFMVLWHKQCSLRMMHGHTWCTWKVFLPGKKIWKKKRIAVEKRSLVLTEL